MDEAEKLKNPNTRDRLWLMLIDDFSRFGKKDLQAIKALLAGENTTILGKWLSLNYRGGLPCVILCNSELQFKELYDDPEIFTQCKFIDLPKGVYLGPPGTKSAIATDFDLIPNAVSFADNEDA